MFHKLSTAVVLFFFVDNVYLQWHARLATSKTGIATLQRVWPYVKPVRDSGFVPSSTTKAAGNASADTYVTMRKVKEAVWPRLLKFQRFAYSLNGSPCKLHQVKF